MFSSHFRLFHIVVFVLTGFHLIVDNIESAFQDQNFHQNFDWLLQQMKNPYKWPFCQQWSQLCYQNPHFCTNTHCLFTSIWFIMHKKLFMYRTMIIMGLARTYHIM